MRYVFIFFCMIFFTHTSVYAKPAQGYKVVLSSFSAFSEAKKALGVAGENLTKVQIALLEKHHCSLLARPSGKGYIVVIEPLIKREEAVTVVKHFKTAFPDGYISGYFGPTQESVFWIIKEPIASEQDNIVGASAALVQTPMQQTSPFEVKGSTLLIWPIIVGVLVIVGLLFTLVLIIKRQKEITLRPVHREINPHQQQAKKEKEISLRFWEYDVALRRTGEKKELLEERIQAFVSKSPAAISQLKEIMLNKEWDNVIACACSLKSLSADIAAAPLRIMSRRLEGAAREYNIDIVTASIFHCEHILDDTLISLRKHIRREEMIKITTQYHPEAGDIDTLETLRTYLEKSLFVDTDKVSVFDHYTHGDIAHEIKELKSTINKLDYIKALELLQHIEGAMQ